MNPSQMTASDFAAYTKRIAAWTMVLGSVLAVAGLLVSRPVALGMLFGVVAGVIKLKIASRGLLKFEVMSEGGKQGHMVRQNWLKLGFTGLVLMAAFSTPLVNEWAALAGLLLPNGVIIADTVRSASVETVAPNADQEA